MDFDPAATTSWLLMLSLLAFALWRYRGKLRKQRTKSKRLGG
jgi:hypothetical protein